MNIEPDANTLKVGVVGAGSWGTALANLLAKKGFKVDHWVFEPEVLQEIKSIGENRRFLPGIKLSNNLSLHNDLEKVVTDKNLLVMVTPSHVLREIATKIASFVSPETILVSASKGIENLTYMTMSEVLVSVVPNMNKNRLAVITGPSFAKEVAKQIPTAVTIASENKELSKFVQLVFATKYFRVYTIDDVIGAELGAALKNVIAIAAGMVNGLNLGLNTRAALITRGLTEIRRLGIVMGANPRTFTGLAGIGDLILTCTDNLSRNYSIGKKIGQGSKLDDLIYGMDMIAEGIRTTESVYYLSKKLNVDMPISHSVYKILYEGLDPSIALHNLMNRDLKQELDNE